MITREISPSPAVLSVVADGLAATATLAQLERIATMSPQLNADRSFRGRRMAQEALIDGYAGAIMVSFENISTKDVKQALRHTSTTPDFSPIAYSSFLSKLRAEGEQGVEMANAFELLKTPGA